MSEVINVFPVNAFMADADRIFYQAGQTLDREQWFFRAREGVMGPYASRETAERELREFKVHCQRTGATGNRPPRTSGAMAGSGAAP
jgi:hypothetical protein